jgi:TonB family protein
MNIGADRHLSLSWFLGIAILLHLGVTLIAWKSKVLTEPKKVQTASEPIEVERIPNEKRKTVVQTSRPEEQDLSDSKDAEFAGEFKNRVKKQMQSRLVGPFREGRVAGNHGKSDSQGAQKVTPDSEVGEGESAEEAGPGPKISDLMVLGRSPHSLSDKIDQGDQTVLNTDKVLYASFINRIAEEVYQPWVSHIEDVLKNIHTMGRKIENNTYVTKLNIAMDKRGEVTGIQIISSSGIPALDEAPKKAFWEMEPFPNPPLQLLEEDGYIRLVYEFHFEYKSSGFNIVPMTI